MDILIIKLPATGCTCRTCQSNTLKNCPSF